MTESPSEDEPKLHIDEDWKEQVQKEKEALRAAQAAGKSQQAAPTPADAESPEDDLDDEDDVDPNRPPPPASFITLVSMLFTQAMAMMGQIPDPASGKPIIDKPIAKHYIDTLEMLEGKAKGNLDGEEAKVLSEALHALRMTYVSVKAPPKE